MKELANSNERLRAHLAEKERDVSDLQMTIHSLESRLGPVVTGEAVDRAGHAPLLTDHSQNSSVDTLHRLVRQLITDGDELDAVGQAVDQVDVLTHCTIPLLTISARTPASASSLLVWRQEGHPVCR